MLDPKLLEILVCPETRSPVSPAGPEVLERVNRAVAAGTCVNRGGQSVSQPLQEGLVREDGRVVYPVRDDIPVMLLDESIELTGLD